MRYAGIIFCFIIENLSVVLTCNLNIDATFVSENIFLCPMCLVSLVLLCKYAYVQLVRMFQGNTVLSSSTELFSLSLHQ